MGVPNPESNRISRRGARPHTGRATRTGAAHGGRISQLPYIRQVLRQVERGGGFRVIGTRTFPMTFNGPSLQSQLKFAREEASHITDPALRTALDEAAKRLRARTEDLGGDRVAPPNARNYAIVLQRDS